MACSCNSYCPVSFVDTCKTVIAPFELEAFKWNSLDLGRLALALGSDTRWPMKFILFLIAVTFSSHSYATLSYCENLNVAEGLKNGWKMNYHEFQIEQSQSFNDKVSKVKNLSARGLRLLYLVDRDTKGENKELISQVNKIITNVNKDVYTKDAAYTMLSFTLPKLQGALDNTVFQGQLKGNCDTGIRKTVEVQRVKSRR